MESCYKCPYLKSKYDVCNNNPSILCWCGKTDIKIFRVTRRRQLYSYLLIFCPFR